MANLFWIPSWNADITRPNQAWSIDITYIPMKHGFLYLIAIIDWHSRCIVGWELNDTLDTRACIEACKKAFHVAKPEILNSDHRVASSPARSTKNFSRRTMYARAWMARAAGLTT